MGFSFLRQRMRLPEMKYAIAINPKLAVRV
jgi:hypothetical protein